jgi:hypothetical protein
VALSISIRKPTPKAEQEIPVKKNKESFFIFHEYVELILS